MRYTFFMPAHAPEAVNHLAQRDLEMLGERLRTQRKALRIAAESVARAANMSRQTLNRIEHGEPSVTMGAYLNALRALGLELKVVGTAQPALADGDTDAVRLADYPQLKRLAWHRKGETLTEKEAFALYERNWRHVDRSNLEPTERDFIARLVKRHGKGVLLV
jgi:transcriptional regulator with XRE-family HTH domain